jgi:hypothetical protein
MRLLLFMTAFAVGLTVLVWIAASEKLRDYTAAQAHDYFC